MPPDPQKIWAYNLLVRLLKAEVFSWSEWGEITEMALRSCDAGGDVRAAVRSVCSRFSPTDWDRRAVERVLQACDGGG
jgi:hypothetical protein